MGTVLHPTDFKSASRSAFEHALWLALKGQHELVVLHVHSNKPAASIWSEFPHVRKTLERWGAIAQGLASSELEAATGLRVRKIEVSASDPAGAVLGYLERNPADLVVVGTEGRTGMDAWVNKSVALQLAANVNQPILFVREGIEGFVDETGGQDLKNVLVPVDVDPDPQWAIDWAVSIPGWWGVGVEELTALHIGERPLDPPVSFEIAGVVTCEALTRPGTPEEEIAKICKELNSDLIVMNRAGPDRLMEKLVGSTTEQVIRTVSCPVLVLKAFSYD